MTVTLSAPRFEHHRTALGIGERRPRLSWRVESAPAGWHQAAARLALSDDEGTRVVELTGDAQVLVPWPFAPLESRRQAHVTVSVRSTDGEWSMPSPAGVVEAGLLDPTDWTARPVGAEWPEQSVPGERRPSIVRSAFRTHGEVRRARLYASAHGLYEAELNGRRVGDDALSPGWTSYRSRLRYLTYDVTDQIRDGENVLGAWLGEGWYRGRLGWRGGFRDLFGSDLSFIAQLEVEYADGTRQTVATDDSWRATVSPILRSGIYDGEDFDAREEPIGWSTPGFDASAWRPVVVGSRDPDTLIAPTGPPVRCTEERRPLAVLTAPSGARILDFGQNLAGRIAFETTGPRGTTIRLRTAEVLQKGEVYTRPLREARSSDAYTLAGRDEPERWEPRFTFHGFRYAEVTGWPGDLDADVAAGRIVARVYHTDMERTGWFECSDPLVDRLHENIVWGMRSNFLDIPTDCPQRDERVGWTGDIQVFGPTASFLYDVSGMLGGWLRDVAVEQLPDGTIPWYVPSIPAYEMWTPIRPGAAWGDVATILPWTLYERFGDTGVLAAQYESARRWVDLIEGLAGADRLWNEGFQLGDWLDPAAPPQDPADAQTDRYLVATAYFARSARLVSRMAEVLGHESDAHRYAELADEVAAAFAAAYIGEDGVMTSDAQTAYALALRFDLLPDAQRARIAGDRLAGLVAAAANRIATGFVGTPLISDALTQAGHLETAYDLLTERECPSWLYQVEMGATTVWERWDSMLPDGTVNPGSMTSFNHYALGAVGDWMHREIAGIAPAAPGYRRIRFAPRPGGGITHASAAHTTPYGRAEIAWELTPTGLRVRIVVPVGTDALLDLEGAPIETLPHGTHERLVRSPEVAA